MSSQQPPLRVRLFYGDSREALAIDKTLRFIDHSIPCHPTQVKIHELATLPDSHDDDVYVATFSPDGSTLASSGRSKKIVFHDVAGSGRVTGTIDTKHTFYCTSLAYSTDGKKICTGSWDKTIRIFSTETHQLIGEPLKGQHNNGITAVRFSPNGKFIASASNDSKVIIWNLATREPRVLAGHASYALSLAYSPDGKVLASAGADKLVCFWNTATEDFSGELIGHTDWVNSLDWSRCGKFIVTGSQDKTVRVWDANEKIELCRFEGSTFFVVSCVSLSPDARTVATGAFNEHVQLFDISNAINQHERELEDAKKKKSAGHSGSSNNRPKPPVPIGDAIHAHESQVRCVAWAPDNSAFVSTSKDGKIKLFNIVKGTVVPSPAGVPDRDDNNNHDDGEDYDGNGHDVIKTDHPIVSMKVVGDEKSSGRGADTESGGMWDDESGGGGGNGNKNNKCAGGGKFIETTDAKGNCKRWPMPADALFEVKRQTYARSLELDKKRAALVTGAENAALAAASNFTGGGGGASTSTTAAEQQQQQQQQNQPDTIAPVVTEEKQQEKIATATATQQHVAEVVEPEKDAAAATSSIERNSAEEDSSMEQKSDGSMVDCEVVGDNNAHHHHHQQQQQAQVHSDPTVVVAAPPTPAAPVTVSTATSATAASADHNTNNTTFSSSSSSWLDSCSSLSKQIKDKLEAEEITTRDMFLSLTDEDLRELFSTLGARKTVKAEIEKLKVQDQVASGKMSAATAAFGRQLDDAFVKFKNEVLAFAESQQMK